VRRPGPPLHRVPYSIGKAVNATKLANGGTGDEEQAHVDRRRAQVKIDNPEGLVGPVPDANLSLW